jgi:uncharacterized protein YgiM (DUF1202 family)
MQTLIRNTILGAVLAFATFAAARAEEAVVNEGKINVRGQPSLIGEVVTQLQRGDKVTVLERVQIENPKPGEPAVWAKIKLPENTPVWVFSPFVKEGVVAASRLNLRAGPGDNYSVIGRIERGTAVKPIRTIEEWMEIEAPKESYAFIDSSLVRTSDGQAAAATVAATSASVAAAAKSGEAPSNSTAAAVVPTPQPTPAQPELEPALQPTPQPERSVETAQISAPPSVAAPPSQEPVATPPPVVAASVQTQPQPQPLPQVASPTPGEPAPEAGKRLVRREGFVRATKSIQAPTWYELVHPQTKAVVNYLHEEKIGVNLKEYRGQKVIVSGEEAIDPRWPNTPIMEIETLEVAP